MTPKRRMQATADLSRMSFVRDEQALKNADGELIGRNGGGESFYGPYELLARTSLSSLKHALIAASDYHGMISNSEHRQKSKPVFGAGMEEPSEGGPKWIVDKVRTKLEWTTDDAAEFDVDIFIPEPGSIVLTDGNELLVEVGIPVEGRDPFEPYPELENVLSSWARRRSVELVSLEGQVSNTYLWSSYFRVPTRGRTVSEIQEFALDAREIGTAFVDGTTTAELLVAVLESGQIAALVGLQESSFFECKRQVRLADERGKLDFAKDVAAFANSGARGLLVIGLETKPKRDGDFVIAVHPVPDAARFARLARRTIDRLVFPPIDDLQVRTAPVGTTGDHLVYCIVPEQAPELKPFMVAGAFVEGRIDGALISIPRRRDDETIHLNPASIHAFLAAGYALFRRPGE